MRALHDAHAARVYATLRRMAGDDAAAEDWAQEAWIRAFSALHRFRGDARFSTWVHRIAINTALNARRRAQRRGTLEVGMSEVGPTSAGAESILLRVRLDRALDALPEGMRTVLVLHDVEGYRHEDIGALLGVTAGTSKSQLFRARARMRELLTARPAGGRSAA